MAKPYMIKRIERQIAHVDEFLAWCKVLKPNKISIHKITDTMRANFASMTFIDESEFVLEYINFIKAKRKNLIDRLEELNNEFEG